MSLGWRVVFMTSGFLGDLFFPFQNFVLTRAIGTIFLGFFTNKDMSDNNFLSAFDGDSVFFSRKHVI